MQPLSRSDLLSLEDYAEQRAEWRQRVMAHKQDRIVDLGPNARLYFEDRLTMQYQVQEMLRAEKIFDASGIREELEVYNALIPNGSDMRATFMLEYADVEQRKVELARLVGIEDALWLRAGGKRSGCANRQRGSGALHPRQNRLRAFCPVRVEPKDGRGPESRRPACLRH